MSSPRRIAWLGVLLCFNTSADATIQLLVPEEARDVGNEILQRREARSPTHPDGRRTVLIASNRDGAVRSKTWRVRFDDSIATDDVYTRLAIGASMAPTFTVLGSRWEDLQTSSILDDGVEYVFHDAVTDPRWRFDVDAFIPACDPPLWPTRTDIDVLVIADTSIPLAGNTVRVRRNPPPGEWERAFVWIGLMIPVATDEVRAWFRSVLTGRQFTPLFSDSRVVSPPRDVPPPPVPRPATLPAIVLGEALTIAQRTVAARVDVLLRENGVRVETDSESAIQLRIVSRVTFESDAFPLGHPELGNEEYIWPLLGLVYYVEFGENVRGSASSPDLWELVEQ